MIIDRDFFINIFILLIGITIGIFTNNLNTIMYLILISIMLVISLYDIKNYIIPNVLIILGILNRIVFIFLSHDSLMYSVLNGLLISVPLLVLSIFVSKLIHKQAMGGGDIKLLFMLGMYFNIYQNVVCLLFACLFSLAFILIKNMKNKQIPFGPFVVCSYLLLILISI